MSNTVGELRIPASPEYILVAKRAAAAFGSIAGLDIESLDDLSIAVAQACSNAMALTTEWSLGCEGVTGELRLEFGMSAAGDAMEVKVKALCPQSESRSRRTEPRLTAYHAASEPVTEAEEEFLADVAAQCDMGLKLMQLFVDDCLYRVDEERHGLHIRLTKYRLA